MPGGDRTGPLGLGPMTGRAAGYCTGFAMPGYANYLPVRGMGAGFGTGRGALCRGFGRGGHGWRNMFCATGIPGWARFGGYARPYHKLDFTMEQHMLKQQAEALQTELDAIKKRMSEIETGDKDE